MICSLSQALENFLGVTILPEALNILSKAGLLAQVQGYFFAS